MIVSNFYPNLEPPGSSYLTAFTDLIGNLTYTDANAIANAYFMGYIPYDEMPDVLGVSLSTVNNGDISFTDACSIENVPWFFVGKYSTNASNRYEDGTFIYNPNTEKMELRDTAQSRGQYGFLNSAAIPSLTNGGDIKIHFTCYMTQADGTYINWWNSTSNTWLDHTLTPAEFFSFMNGDTPITFSINKEGVNTSFDIYYDDLKDGHYLYIHEDTGKKITVFITNFSLPHDYRDVNSNDNTSYFSCVYGAILRHVNHPEYGVVPYITNEYVSHFGYSESDNNFITWNGTSLGNRYQLYPDSGLCMGGWKCNIPASFWNTPNETTEIFGNCVVTHRTGGNNSRIYRMFTPDEINRTLLLRFTRILGADNVGIHYGYRIGIYYPIFNEDNSPKWEWKEGTFDDLVSVLRPWQMSNIILDEFTADDIPPYSPGDDTADSGGDTIAPYDFTNTPLSAANNFTTLYALTTAQVAEFGAIMWAALADPNFWHAVGVEFSNDFSINPADMMRYFNFLRYYPFDLTPYSSQYISGIYIGRSTIPIQFPAGMEYPRRASRNLIQINGGEVTARLPAPYNSDDFFVSDPATQMQAHIPFCGTVQLSAAECYGRTLYLNYVVDLQSGAIQATISVQSDTYYIVATLAGTCGAGVQITANNNIEYLTRIATVATGGISSAATMATRGAQVAGAEGAAAAGVIGALTGTVSALAGLPPVTVHKQGSTTGFANYGGDPRAYITIQAAKRSIPDTYAKSAGYVSNKRARIGDLTGYTEMINPDLSGIEAHQDELTEIYRILQSGFFA